MKACKGLALADFRLIAESGNSFDVTIINDEALNKWVIKVSHDEHGQRVESLLYTFRKSLKTFARLDDALKHTIENCPSLESLKIQLGDTQWNLSKTPSENEGVP